MDRSGGCVKRHEVPTEFDLPVLTDALCMIGDEVARLWQILRLDPRP